MTTQARASSRPGRIHAHPLFWVLPAVVCSVAALGAGPLSFGAAEVFQALSDPDSPQLAARVIWDVRMPRVLSALLAGGALAVSGAALQGVFHNPLVDPHIIGTTSGAALGGTLAIILGLSGAAMMFLAFSFGLASIALLYFAATTSGRSGRLMIILAGILISGFFSAIVSLLQYISDSEETLPSIVFWLMGSFATAGWDKFVLFAPVVSAACVLLFILRWRINLLSLDDRDAAGLGVNVSVLRWSVLALCALAVSCQVAVSGAIGWVGLLIPHLARPIVGFDHRRLIPASFWMGGAFLVAVDSAARTVTNAEIPLGILTAVIGAPLFAFILWKHRMKDVVQ